MSGLGSDSMTGVTSRRRHGIIGSVLRILFVILATFVSILIAFGIFAGTMSTAYADTSQNPPRDAQGDIYVQDQANVLSKSTKSRILSYNNRWNNSSLHAQLLVVTSQGIPGGVSASDYAVSLFEEYKPGDAEQNTGLVYVLDAVGHQDYLATGYGMESIIPDSTAAMIIEQARDDYKKDDYDAGLNKILDGIDDVIKNGSDQFEAAHQPTFWQKAKDGIGRFFSAFIRVLRSFSPYIPFAVILLLMSWLKRNYPGSFGGSSSGGSSSGSSFGGGSGSSFGGSSDGSSSGGSSFGGGSTGGGGAGGSW